jgi:hypothetical protein
VQGPTGAVRARPDYQPRSIDNLEETHPAELCELGLVGMEHEPARVVEIDLDDPALTLAEHHGVGVLERFGRARWVLTKELTVEMK